MPARRGVDEGHPESCPKVRPPTRVRWETARAYRARTRAALVYAHRRQRVVVSDRRMLPAATASSSRGGRLSDSARFGRTASRAVSLAEWERWRFAALRAPRNP